MPFSRCSIVEVEDIEDIRRLTTSELQDLAENSNEHWVLDAIFQLGEPAKNLSMTPYSAIDTEYVDCQLASNFNLPKPLFGKLYSRWVDARYGSITITKLLQNPACPRSLYEKAYVNGYWQFTLINRDSHAPKDIKLKVIRRIMDDSNTNDLRYVAECSDTPIEILENFSLSGDIFIRKGLSLNPAATPEMLEVLYEHTLELHEGHTNDRLGQAVLHNVSVHPNCPEWIKADYFGDTK